MSRANPGMLGVNNLGLAGNEALDERHFFVVNVLQVLGTKKTLLHRG
jgi:hypothetical protein